MIVNFLTVSAAACTDYEFPIGAVIGGTIGGLVIFSFCLKWKHDKRKAQQRSTAPASQPASSNTSRPDNSRPASAPCAASTENEPAPTSQTNQKSCRYTSRNPPLTAPSSAPTPPAYNDLSPSSTAYANPAFQPPAETSNTYPMNPAYQAPIWTTNGAYNFESPATAPNEPPPSYSSLGFHNEQGRSQQPLHVAPSINENNTDLYNERDAYVPPTVAMPSPTYVWN